MVYLGTHTPSQSYENIRREDWGVIPSKQSLSNISPYSCMNRIEVHCAVTQGLDLLLLIMIKHSSLIVVKHHILSNT